MFLLLAVLNRAPRKGIGMEDLKMVVRGGELRVRWKVLEIAVVFVKA